MRWLVLPSLSLALVAAVPNAGTPRIDGCPTGFVRVSGEYCSVVDVQCLEWSGPVQCKQYGPSKCAVPTQHRDFCMERYEHTPSGNDPNELPIANVDFYQAEAICKAEGSRLCKESEFLQACEGSDFNPYPTGHTRDCQKCHCDETENVGPDFEHRTDLRKTGNETKECVSAFGVVSIVGNLDEIYVRDVSPGPYQVVLKGGHWIKGARNRCVDASTVVHSETYSHLTTGFRCCADPKP